jgi:hypothetical protein
MRRSPSVNGSVGDNRRRDGPVFAGARASRYVGQAGSFLHAATCSFATHASRAKPLLDFDPSTSVFMLGCTHVR